MFFHQTVNASTLALRIRCYVESSASTWGANPRGAVFNPSHRSTNILERKLSRYIIGLNNEGRNNLIITVSVISVILKTTSTYVLYTTCFLFLSSTERVLRTGRKRRRWIQSALPSIVILPKESTADLLLRLGKRRSFATISSFEISATNRESLKPECATVSEKQKKKTQFGTNSNWWSRNNEWTQ